MVEESKHNSSSPTVDFTLKQAIRTKAFWLLFAMYALVGFTVSMVMVHIKAYATDVGIRPMIAATILGLVGGGSIIGRLAMGSVSDKIGRKASLFICFLLAGTMMLWLIKARQPWQFYLFSTIFGFGYGGGTPVFPAVIGDWFGMKFHGTILGAITIGLAVGGPIGPFLAGYIYDITGSYGIAIMAGAVALFIAAASSLAMEAPEAGKAT